MTETGKHSWVCAAGICISFLLSALPLKAVDDGAGAMERGMTAFLGTGTPEEKQTALGSMAVEPGNREYLVGQWKNSADNRRRLHALIVLCDILRADEMADLLAETCRNGRADCLEKYIMTAALLDKVDMLQPGARKRPRPDTEKDVSEKDWAGFRAGMLATAQLLGGDDDWRIRRMSAELLGRLNCTGVTAMHRKLLEDEAWCVRVRAIEVLGALPRGENITILEKILARNDKARITDGLAAIRAMADLEYLPGLLAGLDHTGSELEVESIRGFAKQSVLTPECEEALRTRMEKTADERVRLKIKKLLEDRRQSNVEKDKL